MTTKTTTITEALAELKMLQKRIDSKQVAIMPHIVRAEQLKDPLLKDGGQPEYVKAEMQALSALRENQVAIRRAIAEANAATTISVSGVTRSIADWLRWRRDVAPGERDFLRSLVQGIERARQQAVAKGGGLISASANVGDSKPSDVVVNISEVDLNKRYEDLQAVLETLDGQLSLKNATVTVTY